MPRATNSFSAAMRAASSGCGFFPANALALIALGRRLLIASENCAPRFSKVASLASTMTTTQFAPARRARRERPSPLVGRGLVLDSARSSQPLSARLRHGELERPLRLGPIGGPRRGDRRVGVLRPRTSTSTRCESASGGSRITTGTPRPQRPARRHREGRPGRRRPWCICGDTLRRRSGGRRRDGGLGLRRLCDRPLRQARQAGQTERERQRKHQWREVAHVFPFSIGRVPGQATVETARRRFYMPRGPVPNIPVAKRGSCLLAHHTVPVRTCLG